MENLYLAKTTSDIELLTTLSKSVYSNVRRVVAKNINTPKEILRKLSYDPVMNVSYMAVANPKNDIQREFDSNRLHPCVLCEKDEQNLSCISCEKLNKH